MARRIRLSAVPGRIGSERHAKPLDLPLLPLSGIGHGRDDLRGHPQALGAVVPCDVVRDSTQERGQCARAAEDSRARAIPDGLDLAAQATTGDGASGARAALGQRGADEVHVGGKEQGARGRSLGKKALVAVAVEEDGAGMGRVRLQRIPDASAASVEAFLLEAVEEGSAIRTDGWPSYARLRELGYRHDKAVTGGDPDRIERDFPRVHRVAALLKRWLLGTHQGAVEKQHLDYYLDEFTFRFNRRTSRSRGLLFYRLLQQAVATDPVPRKTILGGSSARRVTQEAAVE